mmetsp:Transcript_15653/g.23713  ORF Transcript_15653/g.23713 Transcript_15653/m.23713 type:complete len:105 (+) Transcript_15653:43-357(+)
MSDVLRIQIHYSIGKDFEKLFDDIQSYLIENLQSNQIEIVPKKDLTSTDTFEVTVVGSGEKLYSRMDETTLTMDEKEEILDLITDAIAEAEWMKTRSQRKKPPR